MEAWLVLPRTLPVPSTRKSGRRAEAGSFIFAKNKSDFAGPRVAQLFASNTLNRSGIGSQGLDFCLQSHVLRAQPLHLHCQLLVGALLPPDFEKTPISDQRTAYHSQNGADRQSEEDPPFQRGRSRRVTPSGHQD